jgi:hypothetical protein
MRVNIGPYTSDLIPVRKWETSYERMRAKSLGIHQWDFDESHYQWYDRVADRIFDRLYSLTRPINIWSNNRQRDIDIEIDHYDSWSAGHTLALIITPVLKNLRDHYQGSPMVDPQDVPEPLRPTEDPNEDNGYIDDTHHERWSWVLDEMIWAFEQHAMADSGWEDQFIHNQDQLEILWDKIDDGEFKNHSQLNLNYQKDPSKPPYFRDEEGIQAHRERMTNGLRLFAKYYDGLWN